MFILSALANYADGFKITKKDDLIISLRVSKDNWVNGEKFEVSLNFLDSLSILPSSLKSLPGEEKLSGLR